MRDLIVDNIVKHFNATSKKNDSNKIKKEFALKNVSFIANKGEIFGLLGPNGAGKTTTMRIIATLLKPDSGDVILDGMSVLVNDAKIRSNLAFLTTDLKLDEKSTANEMIEFFGKLHHIPNSILYSRKNELFKKFEISSYANVPIKKLSQGMRQKVSLAVSVIHDPQFIIFDEPTNGLDILSVREVRNFIKDMRDSGKCVIISTHIFELVEKLCDKVGIIVDGKLVYCDKIDLLTNNKSLEDAFYELYYSTQKEEEINSELK